MFEIELFICIKLNLASITYNGWYPMTKPNRTKLRVRVDLEVKAIKVWLLTLQSSRTWTPPPDVVWYQTQKTILEGNFSLCKRYSWFILYLTGRTEVWFKHLDTHRELWPYTNSFAELRQYTHSFTDFINQTQYCRKWTQEKCSL